MTTNPNKCNVLSDITNEYLKEQFMKKVKQDTGIFVNGLAEQCWDWIGYKQKSGHGVWQTDICKELKIIKTHRISMYLYKREEFLKNEELDVLHICDRGQCVNPAHLRMGTQTENNKDRDERGRQVSPPGSKNGMALFTKEQIDEIIKLRSEGVIYRIIAERFNCSRRTIEKICLGKRYKNEIIEPPSAPSIRGMTMERLTRIWQLKDERMTNEQIAKETHTATGTIAKILKQPRP